MDTALSYPINTLIIGFFYLDTPFLPTGTGRGAGFPSVYRTEDHVFLNVVIGTFISDYEYEFSNRIYLPPIITCYTSLIPNVYLCTCE